MQHTIFDLILRPFYKEKINFVEHTIKNVEKSLRPTQEPSNYQVFDSDKFFKRRYHEFEVLTKNLQKRTNQLKCIKEKNLAENQHEHDQFSELKNLQVTTHQTPLNLRRDYHTNHSKRLQERPVNHFMNLNSSR